MRFLVRSAGRYARFRFDLYHPDMLRDALERIRIWTSLYKIEVPTYKQLVWSEIEDLEGQDVPYFHFTPASTHLFSNGGTRSFDFFAEPTIVAVRRRITNLSLTELPALTWELETGLP